MEINKPLKYRIFAFLMVMVFVRPSEAQDFAPVGAEWYFHEAFQQPWITDYIKFRSEKDTLIMGENCRKISKRHKLFCNDRPDVEYLFTRNDTVFFLDTIFNKFQILYDFNASQNSSWIIQTRDELLEIDTLSITVDSLATTQINGQTLKVMHVTYVKIDENQPRTYSSTIIEKFGDIHYMFNWDPFSSSQCDGNISRGIRCYQDGTFGLYSSGLADSCNHALNSFNLMELDASNPIDFFPNPAQDFLELRFKQHSHYRLELLDLKGRSIKFQKLYGSTFTIDLSDLGTGLYAMRIYQGDQFLGVEKLMIK